jgi:hypothetical protein
MELIAHTEDSVGVINADNLVPLQSNLAICAKALDLAAVELQSILGYLHNAGASLAINIVADDLQRSE